MFGRTRSGKTFLSKRVLTNRAAAGRKILVIDVKHTYTLPKHLKARVFSHPNQYHPEWHPVQIFRPHESILFDMDAYDELFQKVFRIAKKRHTPTTVMIDDMNGIMQAGQWPNSVRLCYQLGGELNLQMLAATQRPTWIPIFSMESSSVFWAFRTKWPEDIGRIRALLPGYDPSKLETRRSFFYYNDLQGGPAAIRCRIEDESED